MIKTYEIAQPANPTPVQHIDEDGNVGGRTAANTARTTATKVNPVQHIDAAGVVGGVRPSAYATDDTAMPATPAIVPTGGEYRASATTYTDGDAVVLQSDVNGNLKVTLATALAGEDLTNNVLKTEQQFSPSAVLTADGQVKAAAGFIHSITFSCNDAAPTAGSIIVYNNTAESGTVIYSETFDTTAFRGYSILLDEICSTGIYVGFTTVADINVNVSYR